MRAGLSVGELLEAGAEVFVSHSPLASNPIARAHGASQGFVKAIWNGDRLAGVTAVGHGVSGLVTLCEALVKTDVRRGRDRGLVFAHPTLDEAVAVALAAELKRER